MDNYREQHPADFRADAKLGRFTLTQVAALMLVGVGVMITGLVAVMGRPAAWKVLLALLFWAVIAAEFVFQARRRLERWYAFQGRPRIRGSDASVPAEQDKTVQGLIPVQGVAGPVVTWLNSSQVGIIMRIIPAPTTAIDDLRAQALQARFAEVLKRCVHARVTPSIYVDVEPDLQRPELDRHRHLANRLPAESGLRKIITARLNHHEALAQHESRTVAYHLRLTVDVANTPALQKVKGNQAEAAMGYLREISGEIAEDLGRTGAQVQFLSPESIRDVTMRQLDPAGWRDREPARGTDWAWSVDGHQPILEAPPSALNVDTLPSAQAAETVQWPTPAPEPHPPAPAPDTSMTSSPPEPTPEVRPGGASSPVQASATPATGTWQDLLGKAPQQRPRHRPPPELPGVRPLETKEVLAVVGATHRAGTSTVALNLGYAFKARGNSVAVVSLDGANDIPRWLGISAIVSTEHWVRGVSDLWMPAMRDLTVVPGPTRLPGVPHTLIPGDAIARVIGRTRRETDVVIVDLGTDIGPEARMVLSHATGLIVVLTPESDAVEAAYLRVEQAEAAGLSRNTMALMVNRARSEVAPEGVQPALILPEDEDVSECTRLRTAAVVAAPESPWAQALVHWAHHIEEG